MAIDCRALLLTAHASNQGKTTITAGLAYLLRKTGARVRVFKTGPDYLDPKILEFASGNPVYQLDLWMVGEQDCVKLLHEAASSADVILIEGVMGLFDGTPSTADLAKRFNLPVVGIINVGSMAQSVHALAHGLATFDSKLRYAGTVANSVASDKHAQMILQSARQEASPFLGCISRSAQLSIPSRHLGLVAAEELTELDRIMEASAAAVRETMLPEAPQMVTFEPPDHSTATIPLLDNKRIAVARDAAFSFIYQANLDLLEKLGARLTFFSPLSDVQLPDADCIYLPGGYPELHLDKLQTNAQLTAAIKAHFAAGKSIYAECGGMLYLLESLTNSDDRKADLVGLLPGKAVMQKKLARLGYQQFSLGEKTLRGHTFHYSRCDVAVEPMAFAHHPLDNAPGEPLYKYKSLYASYVHLYFPSNPQAAASLFMGGNQQTRSTA